MIPSGFLLLFITYNVDEGQQAFHSLPQEDITNFAVIDKLEQSFFATGYL